MLMRFLFTDAASTELYTLSLHDALPISEASAEGVATAVERRPLLRVGEDLVGVRDLLEPVLGDRVGVDVGVVLPGQLPRSEEHTSELQSHVNLVCRLLLEKKKNNKCTSI